jgi:hypothetical protein
MDKHTATKKKRADLQNVISRLLEPHECVKGVVAVGSLATGQAREDSDIDAILFMDPVDRYIVPTESIWSPWDDSFHSIFTDDPRIHREGIQLDLYFRDLKKWSNDNFVWPEFDRAGLAGAWVAFDRDGKVAPLIKARTHYDDQTRIERLDAFIVQLGNELNEETVSGNWPRYGSLIAFSRLNAAFDALVSGLFAYNRSWRFEPNRESMLLTRLSWLPDDFERRMLIAQNSPSLDKAGYLQRATMLRELSNELVTQLQQDGVYGDDPDSEAFIRSHDEPGRAWNMGEWNEKRIK